MMITSMPSSIRFLACANLASMLMFGLLIAKTSQATLGSDKSQDTSPTLIHQDWHSSSHKDIEANPQAGARGGGLLYGVWTSLWTLDRNINQEPLCEFKGDEGLEHIPRQMLVKKMVECYKEMSTRRASGSSSGSRNDAIQQSSTSNSRRLLRGGSASKVHAERSAAASKAAVDHAATEGSSPTARSNAQDSKNIEAAFHIDYSGPKTHPPKNN